MAIQVEPIDARLGARIWNVDLSKPLTGSDFDAVHRAWLAHLILVFPAQQAMTPADQIAFCRRFGPIEMHGLSRYALAGNPEVYVVSNVVENGKPVGAAKSGRFWHTDMSYIAAPPMGSFLRSVEIPSKDGDTMFANMYAAYDVLPEMTKRKIAGLKVLHSRVKPYPEWFPDRPPLSDEEKAKLPDVIHPLVRTHPETGRKALYLGGRPAWEIVGMPFDEGRALLRELTEHAVQDRFVYRHRWTLGDAVLWDNRCAMHMATPFDDENERRIMHRVTIAGDRPF